MPRTLVSLWSGTYLLDGTRIVRSAEAPPDVDALVERARMRRTGDLTPEERLLLADPDVGSWVTSDRRLAEHGPRFDSRAPRVVELEAGDPGRLRTTILRDAERALDAAWDPSIHVEEAVRAAADLDRVKNLVGERLGSWAARDAPGLDPGDHGRAADSVLTPSAETSPLGPGDEPLRNARRRLAQLYREVESAQAALAQAVADATPQRTPNLAALLGPDLAARMLAQAGGLARLARLPASTVQVLGAERAFFEHLRGRAPPPRHGLLFLYPAIQSAPRKERGKLARALAGKVVIAARLDLQHAPVRPELARAFEARRADLKARRGAPKSPRGRGRSGPPLHGAPEHR